MPQDKDRSITIVGKNRLELLLETTCIRCLGDGIAPENTSYPCADCEGLGAVLSDAGQVIMNMVWNRTHHHPARVEATLTGGPDPGPEIPQPPPTSHDYRSL